MKEEAGRKTVIWGDGGREEGGGRGGEGGDFVLGFVQIGREKEKGHFDDVQRAPKLPQHLSGGRSWMMIRSGKVLMKFMSLVHFLDTATFSI
ncbi:hypothetical protein KSS87_003262 [Heliosperma pusillum]|nr:hypothetical protein KSS87_003262 [Heliosperma pusillum]